MVRKERLELSRLSAPEPKSGVYTNFTTSAQGHKIAAYYTRCKKPDTPINRRLSGSQEMVGREGLDNIARSNIEWPPGHPQGEGQGWPSLTLVRVPAIGSMKHDTNPGTHHLKFGGP